MAITLVRQAVNTSTSPSGTSAAITITATDASNLLVLTIHVQSSTTTVTSVTDSAGNTWTKAVDLSTSGSYTGIWYLANCQAGITSVTATESTGTGFSGNVSEWSGADTVTPVRATNSIAVTTSPNRAGAATATAGDLAVGAISANSSTTRTLTAGTALTTGTLPAGFTALHAYDIAAVGGSEELQWTTGSSANTGGVIALFKPATAAAVTFTVQPAGTLPAGVPGALTAGTVLSATPAQTNPAGADVGFTSGSVLAALPAGTTPGGATADYSAGTVLAATPAGSAPAGSPAELTTATVLNARPAATLAAASAVTFTGAAVFQRKPGILTPGSVRPALSAGATPRPELAAGTLRGPAYTSGGGS